MKKWEIEYAGHAIRVEDSPSKERLFVDGEMQDEFFGFGFRSRLFGKIRSGDASGERIRVSLGGWFHTCRVFVNDCLVYHSRPDRAASVAIATSHKQNR